MIFWILVSALILIALVIVVFSLVRVEEFSEISREDQNIAIAKDKLASLNKQLENKELSDAQYTIAKDDLENALALDLENLKVNQLHRGGRWLILILVIALPITSTLIYRELGSPELLDPEAKLVELKKPTKNIDNMSVTEIVDLVKKRLNENPKDGEGWYILGRTFMNTQKYSEAATAYRKSYELVGDDPNIMLSLADALAMLNDGSMVGEPEQLVNKALALQPENKIALWLGGLAAEQRNEIPTAFKLWKKLLPLLKKDPNSYNEIKVMLTQLKETFPDLPELDFNEVPVIAMTQVHLSISINASIREKLTGNEQVFVYAKAVTGPPMPLAAKKFKVSDLPVKVTLSDADAMMPQLKLSSVDAFTVGARVSLSGNPIPQKGDFFMEVSPLNKDSSKGLIELNIQKIVK